MTSEPRIPLIAIVGATGTGKSDLAVEIARRFDGEIINGDAMQLYDGLPVITNKIGQSEMKGVPHHLLGCIGLEQETWTVGRFVDEALRKIDEIKSRGCLPILVGGTHYYTQSLLFRESLTEVLPSEVEENSKGALGLDEATDSLLARLKEVDPVMADRWHPNDRRRIQRSLEIYLNTGKPASEIYCEQRARKESQKSRDEQCIETVGRTRFPTLLFWIYADKDVLYPRLEKRVDNMVENGLLSEVRQLRSFQTRYEDQNKIKVDQTRGIWASIGYKQFLDYELAASEGGKSEGEIETLLKLGVERTQAATRQYANRQMRWIRIKLLNALFSAGQASTTFLLDGTDLMQWRKQVVDSALSITNSFLSSEPLPSPTSLSAAANTLLSSRSRHDLSTRPDLWTRKTCEECESTFVTENDWNTHVRSRRHRRKVSERKKMAEANAGERGEADGEE